MAEDRLTKEDWVGEIDKVRMKFRPDLNKINYVATRLLLLLHSPFLTAHFAQPTSIALNSDSESRQMEGD
jgi:hypothetical protein